MSNSSLLFYTTIPLALGFAGAWDTRRVVKSEWYQKVKKPSFNPPRYVFAPIWIYLYISTGYALYLVQNTIPVLSSNSLAFQYELGQWGIYAYWTQFIANILWSKLYFVQREINLALADIILLWVLSIAATGCFFAVNTVAGILMIPYIAWATYAMILTNSVRKLNPDFKNPK